jgi:osmoprotectant transport system permease protein
VSVASVAALATLARDAGSGVRPIVRNPVLLLLVLLALPAVLGLAFVSVAPNRLVSGVGVSLAEIMNPERLAQLTAATGVVLPAALLVLAVFMPTSRWLHAAVALAAAALLAGLIWLAGNVAAQSSVLPSPTPSQLTRVSLGGGFWWLALLTWLAAADALQRQRQLTPASRALMHAVLLAPVVALVISGTLDELSLMKEYQNRREVFDAAWWRHLQIVASALLPALVIGVPLGVASARSRAFATPLFATLNLIQTVPSLALFALLIAPLGIGLAPAAVALTLYALLPVVHATASGLAQVPTAAVEAARGMGMTAQQSFWRVRAPLALPVLVSGLRTTTV